MILRPFLILAFSIVGVVSAESPVLAQQPCDYSVGELIEVQPWFDRDDWYKAVVTAVEDPEVSCRVGVRLEPYPGQVTAETEFIPHENRRHLGGEIAAPAKMPVCPQGQSVAALNATGSLEDAWKALLIRSIEDTENLLGSASVSNLRFTSTFVIEGVRLNFYPTAAEGGTAQVVVADTLICTDNYLDITLTTREDRFTCFRDSGNRMVCALSDPRVIKVEKQLKPR